MTPARSSATTDRPLDRFLARRLEVNWELIAYIVIFALAIALRFWDLGARALHHDEGIHARWAWDLAQGSYRHSPVFHGPLLYVVQGFTFVLFTATDYTARISPALFGVAVVAAPLALRRWLGPAGTLAAVAFLAFSPTVVYFSRFLRMDIYLAFFILVLVVALWSYLQNGRTRWLIVFAVALALAFSTKEAVFLFVAFLLLYLNGHLSLDLAQATLRARDLDVAWRKLALAAALYPIAWAMAGLWPWLKRLRGRVSWRDLPRTGDLLVLTGTLTLPLLTAFAKAPLEAIFAAGPLDYPGVCSTASTRDVAVLTTGFVVAAAVAAFGGLSWRPRTWVIAALLAALIYCTLMTSFWSNPNGLCTGAWGSIDHWQAQQDYRRGGQPWFYYLMLMPAYEFLPLLLALVGGAWALVRGSPFARFLVLWFVFLFAALSFAGEKMPWLNTHLAIPGALLAAWTIQRAWSYAAPVPHDPRRLLAIAFALAAAALAVALLVLDWGPTLGVRLTWGLALAAVSFAAVVFLGWRLGWRLVPLLAALVVVAGLAFFSLRTTISATFERGDVPKDLLIYTQTSPDITRMADQIDDLAAASGRGLDLRIAVDTRRSFAWPWHWYLRDYRGVSYSDMKSGLPPGEFDVVLVNASNREAVARDLAERGAANLALPTPYPHRWWFPEDYKAALSGCAGEEGVSRPCEPYMAETWRKIAAGLFRGTWARDAFAFWRDHEPLRAPGSIDGLAYFPANFDRETGRLVILTLEPARPASDDAGRPTFGSLGSRPGQLSSPIDIEAAPDGSLYVVDSRTAVLQKFDPQGNFLAAIDIRARVSADASPWGLAVGEDGTVFVADTFGWRVLAFDAGLRELELAFGERPTAGGPPGPYNLFGPRDIAIDSAGNLWVTDTGHSRIVIYSPAGEYLREIGAPFTAETRGKGSGPAEFSEPVGIDIAPTGEIVVADMWNARVQILDPSGAYLREFPVPGWGGPGALDKPYLRALRDGRIALSLPSLGEVRLYSDTGVLLTTIAPAGEPLRSPYGIVETPDGKLWIVEGGAARVRLFDSAGAGSAD